MPGPKTVIPRGWEDTEPSRNGTAPTIEKRLRRKRHLVHCLPTTARRGVRKIETIAKKPLFGQNGAKDLWGQEPYLTTDLISCHATSGSFAE